MKETVSRARWTGRFGHVETRERATFAEGLPASRWTATLVAGLALVVAAGCGTAEPNPDDVVDSQTHWRDFTSGPDAPGGPTSSGGSYHGTGNVREPSPELVELARLAPEVQVIMSSPESATLLVPSYGVHRLALPAGSIAPPPPEPLLSTLLVGQGVWEGSTLLQGARPWNFHDPLSPIDVENGRPEGTVHVRRTGGESEVLEFPGPGHHVGSLGDPEHFVRTSTRWEETSRDGCYRGRVYTTTVHLDRVAGGDAQEMSTIEVPGKAWAVVPGPGGLAMVSLVCAANADLTPTFRFRVIGQDGGGSLVAGPAVDLPGPVAGNDWVRWRGDTLELLTFAGLELGWSAFSVDSALQLRIEEELAVSDLSMSVADDQVILTGDSDNTLVLAQFGHASRPGSLDVRVLRRGGFTLDEPVRFELTGFRRPIRHLDTGRLGDGRWLFVEPVTTSAGSHGAPAGSDQDLFAVRILDLASGTLEDALLLSRPQLDSVEHSVQQRRPWLFASPEEHRLSTVGEDASMVALVVGEHSAATGTWAELHLVEVQRDATRLRGVLRHPGEVSGWTFTGDDRVVTTGDQAIAVHDLTDLDNPVSGPPVWLERDTLDLQPVDGGVVLRGHGSIRAGTPGFQPHVERRHRLTFVPSGQPAGTGEGPERVEVGRFVPQTRWRNGLLLLSRPEDDNSGHTPGRVALEHLGFHPDGSTSLDVLGVVDLPNTQGTNLSQTRWTPPFDPVGVPLPTRLVVDDILLIVYELHERVEAPDLRRCTSCGLHHDSPLAQDLCVPRPEGVCDLDEDEMGYSADSDGGQAEDVDPPESEPDCHVFRSSRVCTTYQGGQESCHGRDWICPRGRIPHGTEMGRCRELTPEERRLHVEMTCTESARTRQARRARLARVALTGPGAPRVMAELALAPEERVSDVRELDGDLYLITEEDLIDPDLRAVLVRFSMRRLYPGRDGDNAVGPRIDTPGRPITMADGYLVSARQIPGRMGSSSALHLSHVQGLNVRLLDTYEIGRISGLRIVASDPGHVVFGPVRLGTPANNFMEQFEWLSADLDAQRFERMGSLELKHRGPMHLRDGVLAITPDLLHYQIPLVPGAPMKVSLAVSGDSVEIHRLLFEHGLWHVNHQDPTWDPFRLGW